MSIQVSMLHAGTQIKEAFSKFSQLEFKDGFGKLGELGGDVIALAVTAFTGYLIVDVLQNENLKTHQKILPTIGYLLGICVSLPLAIIIIAGAAALVPPFLFAASCVAVVRNVATYLEERAERNNLKKELISKKDMLKKIEKAKLSPENNEMILHYLEGQDVIYSALYAKRQAIITDGSIGVAQKNEKVLEMNKIIEDLYLANQEESALKVTQLSAIAERIKKADMPEVAEQVTNYNAICQKVDQLDLSPELKKAMMLYRFTHEKIYSQDLSATIKQKYIQLVEGNKIHSDDLKLLYSHLGNHYLNQTPLTQVAIQDENFFTKLRKGNMDAPSLAVITEYTQQPRILYESLMQFREMLPTLLKDDPDLEAKRNEFEHFRTTFISYPNDWQAEWERCKAALGDMAFVAELDQELTKVTASNNAFDELTLDPDLRAYVKAYCKQTLAQSSNSYKAEFPVPCIDLNLKANDLLHRAGIKPAIKKAFGKIDKGFNKLSDLAKEKVLQRITREEVSEETKANDAHQAEVSKLKRGVRHDFNQRYKGIFNVVEKKERLNFLIKAVPRRILNIALSVGVALASLATTFIITAVASPAAPVAVAATAAIGAISAALTGVSLINSAHLIYKNIKGKMKLSTTHNTVSSGVVPTPEYDAAIQAAGKEKIEKHNKNEAKRAAKLAKEDKGEARPQAIVASPIRSSNAPVDETEQNVPSQDVTMSGKKP